MPSSHRFETKAIKNKQKREVVFHKAKKEKGQAKLQRRLENAKREADDPKAKQVCMRYRCLLSQQVFTRNNT